MRSLTQLLIILLNLFLLLCGCAQPSSTPDPDSILINNYLETVVVNQVQGAMVGQIISTTDNQPLTNTVVRLAKVLWDDKSSEGTFVLSGASSPGDITDELGVFVIDELDPADYVIVVGDVIGYNEIISESDGSAKIYTIVAGEALEIESLRVNLP